MKKILLILILIGGVGALYSAYYMGTKKNADVEPIVTVIDLTASQKKQIAQDATLGWLPEDSIWALAKTLIRWEVVDSTHWDYKDSTRWNIKDSTAITYIPFYEAEDTIVYFDEMDILQDIRVQLTLAIKPRFFPTYNKFLTETQLRELTVTIPEPEESWWKHRWVIYVGGGLSYSQRSYNGESTWCWGIPSIQAGIGIRLY